MASQQQHKHHHNPKHHLSSGPKVDNYSDVAGWMEGITSLSDTDRATDLLATQLQQAPAAATAAAAAATQQATASTANGIGVHHRTTPSPTDVSEAMAQLRMGGGAAEVRRD